MAAVKIIGKVAVKVVPDTDTFKEVLQGKLDSIEKKIGDLKVNVVPQIDKSAEQVLKKQMEALRERLDGKNISFDVGIDKGDIARVEAAIAALTRDRRVEVKVDVDNVGVDSFVKSLLTLGGARPQIDALHEGFEKLKNIDYIAISTGVMATKVTLLGAAALATAGHVFTLGSDLLSIANVGLALPGIFAGMVISLGISAAAFKDFNKYVPQAAGYMSELQDVISTNFWDEAATQINAFVDGVFPILHKNLRETATLLGSFFGSFAASLGTTLNPALKGMFDDLGLSIQIAEKHTDSFANIIKVLGEAGAGFLPRLAGWFGDASDSFSNFLSKAQADGPLTEWINEGITNLKALGSVLKSTYDIFGGIADAAAEAGGASLTGLANGLEKISEAVNSEGFRTGLTDVFKTAFTMMEAINKTAGPGLEAMFLSLADVFNTVGPGLATSFGGIIGALGDTLSDPQLKADAVALFDGISKAMDNLTPAIAPIVSMMSSLGPVFAALLDAISAIGTQGIDKLAPTFVALSKAFVPLIQKVSGFFQNVLGDLTPVFQIMGENIAKVVKAFVPLVGAIEDLWNMLSPVLIPVLKIVVTILGDMLLGVVKGVTMVFKGLVKIIGGVVDVFKGIGDVIAGVFTGDFSRIGDGFKQIFGGLKDIILGALEAVAGAIWAWINGSFFSIFRNLGGKLFGKLLAPIKKAFDAVKEFLSPAMGRIFSVSSDGIAKVETVWTRMGDLMGKAIKPFIDAFKAIGGFIKGVFDVIVGIFNLFFGGIAIVIKTYIQIWVDIFKVAFKVVETVFSAAWTVISTLVTKAWQGIVEFFTTAMEGLYFLFKGPWDEIMDFLIGLWTNIKVQAMLIWDALRAFFTGFVDGVKVIFGDAWAAISTGVVAAFTAVKTFFVGIWDAIALVFTTVGGKVGTFLKNLWDDISKVAKDLWGGLKDWLRSKFDLIKADAEIVFTAIRNKLGDVWDAVQSKVTGVWNAVWKKIGDVWDSIKGTIGDAATSVKEALAETWTTIVTKVKGAWDDVSTKVVTGVKDVITEVSALPGKALTALTGIGSTLIASGNSLITGFITGMGQKFEDAKDNLLAFLKDLRDMLPFSPAKVGPFSGKGYTLYSGQALMGDFGKGMQSQERSVVSAALGVITQVSDVIDSASGDFEIAVRATLDTSALDTTAIGSLSSKVGSSVASPAAPAAAGGNVQIDNITIPLEDLQQLKSLEDFLDMLRVRTRQGVLS